MATITSASLSSQTHRRAGPVQASRRSSASSGASSSPGRSTPTGRSSTTCAVPGPPAAPSRRRCRLRSSRWSPKSGPRRRCKPSRTFIATDAFWPRALARLRLARDHGASPTAGFPPSSRHERTYPMTRLRCAILDDYSISPWRSPTGRRSTDRVDITVFNQPFASPEAVGQRAEGFRDHLRDARAHAVSARAARGPAEAEAADHLGHAQRRDRHGSRQGAR